jgi:hypothetical protein
MPCMSLSLSLTIYVTAILLYLLFSFLFFPFIYSDAQIQLRSSKRFGPSSCCVVKVIASRIW